MSSQKRRAAGRRRAWGRGPVILRFESLESRLVMSTTSTAAQGLPDLVGSTFATPHSLSWGQTFDAVGTILNQGNGPTSGTVNVEVLASTTATINSSAVVLGEVTVPAGLAAGQSSSFNQTFTLPPTAIPDYSSGSPIYIDLWINPNRQLPESNYKNDFGVGSGYDVSPVAIAAIEPSLLEGSAFAVTPTATTWGQTVTVTAQVRNNAQGDAPATQARIVLTPSGLDPGSPYDFTIGTLNVPAIAAWQTVNIVQQITLPASPPQSLTGDSTFTLSMAQDANYLTNVVSPHVADQGAGLDQTAITINSDATTPAAPTTLPDMAPSDVTTSSKSLFWGYNAQVDATIQNLGQADVGPFTVRFLLTGSGGSTANSIFLGQTTVPGLAAGSSQTISQTVQLPNQLPSGFNVASAGVGRIAVVVDPDQAINETLRTNDLAESAPLAIRVLGTDASSSVPTSPSVSTTLGSPQPAGTVAATTTTTTATATATTGDSTGPSTGGAATAPGAAAAAAQSRTQARAQARIARLQALTDARMAHKIHRRTPPPQQESLASKVTDQVLNIPSNVQNFVLDILSGKNVATTKKKT